MAGSFDIYRLYFQQRRKHIKNVQKSIRIGKVVGNNEEARKNLDLLTLYSGENKQRKKRSILDSLKKEFSKSLEEIVLETRQFIDVAKLNGFEATMKASYNFLAFETDMLWHQSGEHIIFTEDLHTANFISNIKIKCNEKAVFKMPHSSFIMAMPSGTILNGVKIPSFSVTERAEEDVMSLICDDFDCTGNMLHIDFDSAITGDRCNYCVKPEDLAKTIMAGDANMLFEKDNSSIASDAKRMELYQIMKYLVSFCLYNQVSEGKCIHKGLPGIIKEKSLMLQKSTKPTYRHLKILGSHKQQQNGYHPAHYRQLSNDIYYQGEFKHLEKGSRFVLVEDYITGKNVTAETIKSKISYAA